MTAIKFDINILHSNFDILRASKKLSKKEFCDLIGVANAYRRDFSSIGPKLLKGITDHFKGINENWLLSSHDVDYKYDVMSNAPINEAPPPYGAMPTTNDHPDISPLLLKTAVVLESPSIFSSALKSNIEAFHQAVTLDQKLIKAQAEIVQHTDKLKDQDDRLKILESRLLSEKTEKTG